MTRVTYVPQENGDPLTTSFGGFDFRNGEPVNIPDDATVLQTQIAEVGKTPDGDLRFRGVERKVPLVDVLKTNPYFRIEGMEAPKRAGPGRPRTPRTPEDYKGYAMDWFSRSENHIALAERWKAEAELRERIGVHDDGDICRYLTPFYEGRFHQLKKAAA